jgi:hypothetical protein
MADEQIVFHRPHATEHHTDGAHQMQPQSADEVELQAATAV